jgi:hypothetical protein
MYVVGQQIWVDEGDSVGCAEFGGTIEAVDDGVLIVRVSSHPILVGVARGSLRRVDPELVDVVVDE